MPPAKNKQDKIITVIIFLLIGFIAFIAYPTCKNPGGSVDNTSRDLNAKVDVTGNSIIQIQNQDNFTWTETEFHINKDYKFMAGSVNPGEVKSVPVSEFINGKHKRFNSFEYKIESISIFSYIDGRQHFAFYGSRK